ncbi:MAG TPA: membrane protein insertase YidC [Aquabacterium sp.]|uniref:membrane protein insertase YidC n=1 Tax=Aquabacterium sp. TaxID=1872578 RepID=UPI002E372CAA|nr:membrane protein insertase YidC [Aquabacterium sp.]HEX5354641.1 membrane protein insertase YidC [Aquabacterium sp.]
MNDLRRTLLWSVFAVSLLMLWDGWLRHTGQPSLFEPAPAASVAVASGASGADAAVPQASTQLASAGGVPAAAAQAASGASAVAPAHSEQLTITTDVVKATIDTLGGSLVKVELLKHQDQDNHEHNMVVLDQTATHTYVAQSGLIGSNAAEGALPTHKTPFTVLSTERTLADGARELAVKLESAPVNGVKLVKTYTFKRGDYAIDVKQDVVNASAAAIKPQLYVQLQRDGSEPKAAAGPAFMGGPVAYTGMAIFNQKGKYQKAEFKGIEEGKVEFEKVDDNGWVAMVQHHFASAWLQNDKLTREFFAQKVGTNLYAAGMLFPLGEIAAGQSKSFDAKLFVGPQEENKLKELAPGLEYTKDYGWTHIMAAPLFWLLDKLHSLIGNWGWAIVALVVLLKAVFYPLNASAYRSMGKMKALNPRIQAMRESFKDDQAKMQQEMLKIYREEKVNPIGGCLPILIQIPVFIALYSVLSSSVEIRNAPWIGWITDLSVKDPFFVLPALMTASTLLQTWLNPTPPDPVQAKMMWIMPLLFSVMFFFFPAGLVLYWFTNNVLSIAQQWMINKQLGVTN